MLYSETFDSSYALTRFVNEKRLRKEDIVQITHVKLMIGYSSSSVYTLFYER